MKGCRPTYQHLPCSSDSHCQATKMESQTLCVHSAACQNTTIFNLQLKGRCNPLQSNQVGVDVACTLYQVVCLVCESQCEQACAYLCKPSASARASSSLTLTGSQSLQHAKYLAVNSCLEKYRCSWGEAVITDDSVPDHRKPELDHINTTNSSRNDCAHS